jgi:hypothetical protein
MTDTVMAHADADALEETTHESAQRRLARSLKSIGGDYELLIKRLRQPYGRTLTEADRSDIRNFLRKLHEAAEAELARTGGEGFDFAWSYDFDD